MKIVEYKEPICEFCGKPFNVTGHCEEIISGGYGCCCTGTIEVKPKI
jgi:hypothetical protein